MHKLILEVRKALKGIKPMDIEEGLQKFSKFQDLKKLEAKVIKVH